MPGTNADRHSNSSKLQNTQAHTRQLLPDQIKHSFTELGWSGDVRIFKAFRHSRCPTPVASVVWSRKGNCCIIFARKENTCDCGGYAKMQPVWIPCIQLHSDLQLIRVCSSNKPCKVTNSNTTATENTMEILLANPVTPLLCLCCIVCEVCQICNAFSR